MHVRPYVRARADKRPDVTCGGVWGYIDSSANSKTISVNFSAGDIWLGMWAGAADTGVPGNWTKLLWLPCYSGFGITLGALTLATSGSSFTTGGVSGYSTRVFSLWRNTSGVGQVLTAANTASPTSATVTFPALNLTTMNATVGRFYLSATNAGLSSTSNLDEVAFLFANWDTARVWTHADGGQSGRLTRNLVSASASLSASVNWGSFLVELLPKVA